jgi:hypothetical protein
MLPKLVSAAIGDGTVSTYTYGSKGDTLVKGLEQYQKRNNVNAKAADNLIRLIKTDKDDWIGRVVAMRDEIAHARGVRGYQFEPVQAADGKVGVQGPRFMGIDTLAFMRLVYSNNIEFHQEFMCLTLGLRAAGLVLVPENSGRMGQQYREYGKYVRWAWAMRGAEPTTAPSSDTSPPKTGE